MSKKRSKKYNPNRTLQINSHLNEDYIIYAVDSIAMGALNKQGSPVVVNDLQYRVLQHSLSPRLCFAGVLYKDENGEIQIEYTEFTTSRCSGSDAMVEINRFANNYCDQIGLSNILGKFYFVTGDLEWELDDVFLYSVLKRVGAFDLLMTRDEYVQAELEDQEEFMSKFDPKATQVGGDHYSRLTIQPIEVIKGLRLSWNLANAYKYIARHANKNKQQDLAKAYDYIAREMHDGFEIAYHAKPVITADKTAEFRAQFTGNQAVLLHEIELFHRKRWVKSNPEHAQDWQVGLNSIMYNINQLCKETYGVRAY